MADRYTKTALTIIAAALVGLLIGEWTPKARAQITSACGTYLNPCYIKADVPIQVVVLH